MRACSFRCLFLAKVCWCVSTSGPLNSKLLWCMSQFSPGHIFSLLTKESPLQVAYILWKFSVHFSTVPQLLPERQLHFGKSFVAFFTSSYVIPLECSHIKPLAILYFIKNWLLFHLLVLQSSQVFTISIARDMD